MLPNFYAQAESFPRYFSHKGMIYEWSGEQFANTSALVFEAKQGPGMTRDIVDLMAELPHDTFFTMLIAIYYRFSVSLVEVRSQIIDEETHVYVTCQGTECHLVYRAWENSNCPLFTTDVCRPTHLLVNTCQPWSGEIHTPLDLHLRLRGEMTAELHKPMNWTSEFRYMYGYAVLVHYGITGWEALDTFTENYLEEHPSKYADKDPIPLDAGTCIILQRQVIDSTVYHLHCLERFLSPLGFVKVKFTVTWINTTGQLFQFRNCDLAVVAQPSFINNVYIKSCVMDDIILEPMCSSGRFFQNYARSVDWPDLAHCICRIYTAIMSNSHILMLCTMADHGIVYADNKQYINGIMVPIPINFSQPVIPHKDAEQLDEYMNELQRYFFVKERGIDYAFPVAGALHDYFVLAFCRMDTYYAQDGKFEDLRRDFNNPNIGFEILADTETNLYFAIVDMPCASRAMSNRRGANRMTLPYTFCGFLEYEQEWPEIPLDKILSNLLSIVIKSSSPMQFLTVGDPHYKSLIKRCEGYKVRQDTHYAGFAWADEVNLMFRDGFESAYVKAVQDTFYKKEELDVTALTPEGKEMAERLGIIVKNSADFEPDEVPVTPDEPEKKPFWKKLFGR